MQKKQQKLNEYFYLNKRGRYDLWRVDPSKGYYRHVKEMNFKEYQEYQKQNAWAVRCKSA